MNKTISLSIILVLVAGSAGGYMYAQNMANAYKGIIFTVNDVSGEILNQNEFMLVFGVTLDNPSNTKLLIPETEFQVNIDQQPLTTGTIQPTTLQPNSETQSTLSLTLNKQDLQNTGLNTLTKKLLTGEPTTITIQGTIKAQALFLTAEIPFNKQIMDPEKPRLTITTTPKPSTKDQTVIITVTDPQGATVQGSGIYMVPIIQSIASANVIEDGQYIGSTDSNGELELQFSQPDLYALVAVKPLRYRVGLTEHRVKILDTNIADNIPDLNGSDIIDNVTDSINETIHEIPLSVTLLTPLDQAETGSSETTFQTLVTRAGVPVQDAVVTLYLNEDMAGQSATGLMGKADFTTHLEEGSMTWYVVASKDGETVTSHVRSITCNLPEVTVSLVSPQYGEAVTGEQVTLSVKVEGVERFNEMGILFYIDDIPVGGESLDLFGRASVLVPVSVGEHEWYAELMDGEQVLTSSLVGRFTVVEPVEEFDFSLSVSPSSGSVSKGDSIDFTVSVDRVSGEPEAVWLTYSGLPSAVKTFSDNSGYPSFSSTLTVDTGMLTIKGTHTITITAYTEDWSISRQVEISIEVT